MSQPGHLFVWQRQVARLAADGLDPFDGPQPHARRLLAFAFMFSATCKGSTGRECWLSPDVLATFSQRSAERYLKALIDVQLVNRTAAPTRGRSGAAQGRRARYALNVRHEHAQPWRTKATGEVADDSTSRNTARAQTSNVVALSLSTSSATATHNGVAVRHTYPRSCALRGAA